MRQVTAEKFFSVIVPLDVTGTPEGNYPYKTIFRLRSGGRVVGMIVDHNEHGGFILREHFLSDVEARKP